MAFFISPATKLERAVRSLLILQGKATWADAFISNESRDRPLPNRTMVSRNFSPTRPYRPEGVCSLEIQHHFFGVAQPGEVDTITSVAMDAYLGDTMDTLNLG